LWHTFLIDIKKQNNMSRAFTKESDDQKLEDIAPTVRALSVFLTRENGGIPVYEKRNYIDTEGHTIYEMNNGFSYTINDYGQWLMLEDE
jgi:hypothetical protein